MPSVENDIRCEGCGIHMALDQVHAEGCPVVTVKVTDKRELKRREAEAKRLASLARTSLDLADDVIGAVLEDEDALDPVADAHARIAELRALDRTLTEQEQDHLLAAQAAIEAARVDEQAGEVEVIDARTAFLVVVMPNGETKAYADCNVPVNIEREATFDEMYSACAIVTRDIESAITAKHVMLTINVAGQAMAEKSAMTKMQQRLGGMPPRAGRR